MKSVQVREQQLIRDRLAMSEAHSIRRRNLEAREQSVLVRKQPPSSDSDRTSRLTSSESPSNVSTIIVKETKFAAILASPEVASASKDSCTVSGFSMASCGPRSSPPLRRVARRENLRSNFLLVQGKGASTIATPVEDDTAFTSQRKLRSDGDLHRTALGPSSKSNIPMPCSRIPLPKGRSAQNLAKLIALEKKANVSEKQSQEPKSSASPSTPQLIGRTPRYQLRSLTAKGLKGANLRCL